MKFSDIKNIPEITSQKGMKLEPSIDPKVGLIEKNIHNFPIGTRIKFPKTVDEVKTCICAIPYYLWNPYRQSRQPDGKFGTNGCYDYHEIERLLLLVSVDDQPRWIFVDSLYPRTHKCDLLNHPLQFALRRAEDDRQRILYLLDKTVKVASKKKYWFPVFENGERTGKYARRTCSILQEVY